MNQLNLAGHVAEDCLNVFDLEIKDKVFPAVRRRGVRFFAEDGFMKCGAVMQRKPAVKLNEISMVLNDRKAHDAAVKSL